MLMKKMTMYLMFVICLLGVMTSCEKNDVARSLEGSKWKGTSMMTDIEIRFNPNNQIEMTLSGYLAAEVSGTYNVNGYALEFHVTEVQGYTGGIIKENTIIPAVIENNGKYMDVEARTSDNDTYVFVLKRTN